MKFDRLHSDIEFNCTDQVAENTGDIFTRKLRGNSVKDRDFESYWEQGKRPSDEQLCDRDIVCKYKGVSIHKHESEHKIIKHYEYMHKFAPKHLEGRYYCIFKLREGAGKVWRTGGGGIKPKHYTFFKSDNFEIDMLGAVKIKGF